MKVVQISSVHYSKDTRIFYKICKSLINNGYDLDLVIQHPKSEQVEGVNIIALPIAKRKLARITKVIPRLVFQVIKYPRRTIFHFHDPELILVGLLLKLLGHKVIYDVHEDVPKAILSKKWISKGFKIPLSFLTKVVEKIGAVFFDAIITVVPSISSRFESNNNRVVEIRNYPKIQEYNLNHHSPPQKGENVVYIGSLSFARGINFLIDAIQHVKNKNIKLLVGGTFDDKGLEEEVKISKGWGRTKYIGWVCREDIFKIYQSSIAGMVTLKDTPSYRDALPVKLFEYMLAGIPVIATDIPFWREIIENVECGLLVQYDDPKKIAKAIDWIISHPKEAEIMGRNGRKAVLEKYNWEQEEKKLIKLYRELSSE